MEKDSPKYLGSLGDVQPEIYLNVDHLRSGEYVVHFTLKEKIIKTVVFKKE